MYNAMELILWGRDRTELPDLDLTSWKQVAARCYRNALVDNETFGGQDKWIRLVCGALAVRAMQRTGPGWHALAEQYHRRYWDRTDDLDDESDLQVATEYVVDMEDAHRAGIADFTEG